jgi:hypothetical protein
MHRLLPSFLRLCLTALLLATCSAYASVSIPAGAVGWWRGEGDNSDFFGNGSTVIPGGATFAPGFVGQAFGFSGAGFGVVVGNPAAFQLQDFTIEAWIKRADAGAVSQNAPGAAIFAGGTGSYSLAIETTGQLSFGQVGVSKVTSAATVTDTAWHHVAVTKAGAGVNFYIDGDAAGSASYSAAFYFNTPFAIGSLGATVGVNYTFWGQIDELGLYNRAVSGAEISAIFGAGIAGKSTDILSLTAGAPSPVRAGADFLTRFSAKNVGTNSATNVVLNITLPAGYTLVANAASLGINTVSATTVQNTVARLLPNQSVTVTLTGHGAVPSPLLIHGQVSRDGVESSSADARVSLVGPGGSTPDGIVGWWRAEGNGRDALGNGDPVVPGGAAFAPGVVGEAFSFSGGGFGVQVGNPPAFQLQTFTMEAWIKRSSPTATSQVFPSNGVIFSGGPGSYAFGLWGTGELFLSHVAADLVTSESKVTDTEWHHVAVSEDGATARFYIDGAPAGTVAYAPNFTFTTPFAVGSLGTIFDNYRLTFWGLIDETSLYGRVLSDAEIGTVYASGAAGKNHENISLQASAPSAVQPGEDFTVSVTVANEGFEVAANVVANTGLPAGFALVTSTTSQGANDVTDTSVKTTFGTLFPGETAIATLTGRFSAPGNAVFVSQVTRDGADLTAGDNQASASVEVLGPCVPPLDGLVVLLRGDGTAADAMSHAANFTGNSYGPGRVGQAFAFDGTSEVAIPDSPDLDLASFTLEAWVYPTLVDGTVDIIANKETYPDALNKIQFEFGIKGPLNDAPSTLPMGNLAFFLSGIAGLPDSYGGWTDAQAQIPLNQWTHVALTVTTGTVKAYVNGAVVFSQGGLTGSPVLGKGPLRIGARDNTYLGQRPQDRFNGAIDEFGYYSRALTDTEIAAIYQAGGAGKCVSAVAPTIRVPPASQSVPAGRDVTLGVVATGTGPLTYQWRFKGANIPGATNSTLTVPTVRRSSAGEYDVIVCNATGCTPPAVATLAVTPVPAVVRIANASAPSLQEASVPIVLIGNGVENTLSFSVRFDTNRLTFVDADLGEDGASGQILLNSSKAVQGLLGVSLGLPSGMVFSQETNVIMRLRFVTAPVSANVTTPVTFTGSPTAQKLFDTNGLALQSSWVSGTLSIQAVDFEGDVSPLPNGDKQLDITDLIQVGRYVAVLENLVAGPIFRRADCAPLASAGDGVLSVSDWVQAGRFVGGLDLAVAADGPSAPQAYTAAPPSAERVIRLGGGTLVAGMPQEIPVTLAASGGENAVGFSVNYDPTVLQLVGVVKGAGSQKATLNVNSRQAGKVGVALALNVGAKFPAGLVEVARLQFQALGGTAAALAFGDAPVVREVASPLAEALPVSWQGVSLGVTLPSVNVRRITTVDGPAVELTWLASLTGASLETTDSLGGTWAAVAVTPTVANGQNKVVLPLSAAAAYFHLRLQ